MTPTVKDDFVYDPYNRKLCKIVLVEGQLSLEFPERDRYWRKGRGAPVVGLLDLVRVVAASQAGKGE